jgi:hypothetical protein
MATTPVDRSPTHASAHQLFRMKEPQLIKRSKFFKSFLGKTCIREKESHTFVVLFKCINWTYQPNIMKQENLVTIARADLVFASQNCEQTFININKRLNTNTTVFWHGGLSNWLIVFNEEKCYKHGDIY